MKIKNEETLQDGKIKVSVCMCKGDKSTCKPSDRVSKIFKSKETLIKWIKSFNVNRKSKAIS